MNIVPMVEHTAAEQTLFSAQGVDEAALASLRKSGLPTKRMESWHYTDLRKLLRVVPNNLVKPRTDNASTFLFGKVLEAGEAPAAPSHFSEDNAIGKLNAAFAKAGVTLSLVGDTHETPFIIPADVSEGSGHTRNHIKIANGAHGTIIEHHGGTNAFSTTVSELHVGERARVTYVISQQTDKNSTHLGQVNISLGKDARLILFVLNAGGQLVRQEVNVNVAGEGAEFQLRGVNLVGNDQHIDVTMDLNHAVPHTQSEEIIRNVVLGKGQGVFQGKIRVSQIAQKTDAKMACNTLLMSEDGNFSTKPELEIFADDVACGHGATFADIEPSYLFYLMSRGIPEKEARTLLIKGFVGEVVEDIDNQALEECMVSIINGWLDANV